MLVLPCGNFHAQSSHKELLTAQASYLGTTQQRSSNHVWGAWAPDTYCDAGAFIQLNADVLDTTFNRNVQSRQLSHQHAGTMQAASCKASLSAHAALYTSIKAGSWQCVQTSH